jgi:hypothetical protein
MNAVLPRPRFHVIAIYAIAALVFVGFARTFFLKYWFETPALTKLLHLHGAVFTSWLALHYTQARLIAARRVDLHRRLGIFGAVLGYSMFFLGVSVAIQSAALGHVPTGVPPLEFMSVPVGTVTAFVLLLTAALLMGKTETWQHIAAWLVSFATPMSLT